MGGTSRDVRDILELGSAPGAPTGLALQPPRRTGGGPPGPPVKRPDGITRELYALIGDNAPSLALAQSAKPKFKERVKRPGASGVKWQWIPFTNPARGDATPGDEGDRERDARKKLRLRHWVRDLPADHVEGAPDFKFHKFNTSSLPYSYTTEEYNHFLREDDWPREETDHLFALAQQYDVRFVVMADRWEYPSERSVDDLKARYYSVCRKLVRNRPAADEAVRQATIASLSFDKNRETDRKSYLRSLLSRTPAQIAEEDFLYVESRRLEQSYSKITQERAELLKILGGREGIGAQGGMNVGVGGGAKGANVRTDAGGQGALKRKGGPGWELEGLNGGGLPDGWAGEGSKRKATVTQDIANCIERHPAPSVSATKATLYPSVSIRSARVAQPKHTNLQKVQAALVELGISTHLVMPTKGNVEKLDGLQEALGKLVELKKANDRIESEMRMVRKRKEVILDPKPDPDSEAAQRLNSLCMVCHPASGFKAFLTPAGSVTPSKEYAVPAGGVGDVLVYVVAPPGPQAAFRVFFSREHSLLPLQSFESYACFLSVGNEPSVCKIFACGEGVNRSANEIPFCLDGIFGPAPANLRATQDAVIQLRLLRCRMKSGTVKGIGNMLLKDVEWMENDNSPAAVFTWYYTASEEQLEELGVKPAAKPSSPNPIDELRQASSSAYSAHFSTQPPDAVLLSNAFLRKTNDVLLQLLTPSQKITFLSILAKETTLLSPEQASQFDKARKRMLATEDERRAGGPADARKAQTSESRSTLGLSITTTATATRSLVESPNGSGSAGSRPGSAMRRASPIKAYFDVTAGRDKEN
ncbi:hypothetical protein RQP46_005453 [Phenoliferia psychrophenolica]